MFAIIFIFIAMPYHNAACVLDTFLRICREQQMKREKFPFCIDDKFRFQFIGNKISPEGRIDNKKSSFGAESCRN